MKTSTHHQKIILGSSSVYRQALLKKLEIPFEVMNPDVDEAVQDNELPEQAALRLAIAKAKKVAELCHDGLIIGSDQVAELSGVHLGKPLNHVNATKQLQLMRGKEVKFHTGLCLFNSQNNRLQSRVVPCYVKFRDYSDEQIENYLHKEQPYHCAGSAKSEGLGIVLIERMTGDDPNALVGLPLIALVEMLSNEGVHII